LLNSSRGVASLASSVFTGYEPKYNEYCFLWVEKGYPSLR
jgi:hypothetical protein